MVQNTNALLYHSTITCPYYIYIPQHYGRVGDTPMENPETWDLDNESQDNFQMKILFNN